VCVCGEGGGGLLLLALINPEKQPAVEETLSDGLNLRADRQVEVMRLQAGRGGWTPNPTGVRQVINTGSWV